MAISVKHLGGNQLDQLTKTSVMCNQITERVTNKTTKKLSKKDIDFIIFLPFVLLIILEVVIRIVLQNTVTEISIVCLQLTYKPVHTCRFRM